MFENIKKEPDDIFGKTDGANIPSVVSAAQTIVAPPISPLINQTPAIPSTPPALMPQVLSTKKSLPWKSILVILGGGILIAAAAYFISRMLLSAPASQTEGLPNVSNAVQEKVNTEPKTNTPTTQANTPTTTTPAITNPPPEETPKDSDKDGLSDAREAELGTDPNKADTDSDGLFDREEVEVYKTNPLSADTDGDTYLDGAEVKSGYNPNGAGKLFTVPGTN